MAKRKNTSVNDGLTRGNWMKGLHRLNNVELLTQFISLWDKIQTVHLSSLPDSIVWKLNNSGSYTANSAYNIQCIGLVRRTDLHAVWRVRTEAKVKFFLWLLLQNRL